MVSHCQKLCGKLCGLADGKKNFAKENVTVRQSDAVNLEEDFMVYHYIDSH